MPKIAISPPNNPIDRIAENASFYMAAKSEKSPSKAEIIKNAVVSYTVDLLNFSLDDLGNGERLRAVFGEDIRFSKAEFNNWFIWNGYVWEEDTSLEIYRRAASTMKSFQNQALDAFVELSKQCQADPENETLKKALAQVKAVKSFADKSGNYHKICAMLTDCSAHCPLDFEKLDKKPYLIACKNGTYDFQKAKLREANREDFLTMYADVNYTLLAAAPRFKKFISEIFDNDSELIEYVQCALGYSITGLTTEQIFFLCYGSGNNGKSVLFGILSHILKDYCQTIKISTLLDVDRKSNEASPELARARGKRIIFATESKEGSALNEPMIKQITGGEPIPVRRLHTDGFSYIPSYKVWLATNHKPIIKGTDYGIWRRVQLIPFKVCIPKDKIDKLLLEKLKEESSGIFAWLVDGAIKYIKNGLPKCAAVEVATSEYRSDMDLLSKFLDDCAVSNERESVGAANLYDIHQKWGRETSNPIITSQTLFGKRLAEKGIEKKRVTSGYVYKGLALSEYGKTISAKPEVKPIKF